MLANNDITITIGFSILPPFQVNCPNPLPITILTQNMPFTFTDTDDQPNMAPIRTLATPTMTQHNPLPNSSMISIIMAPIL